MDTQCYTSSAAHKLLSKWLKTNMAVLLYTLSIIMSDQNKNIMNQSFGNLDVHNIWQFSGRILIFVLLIFHLIKTQDNLSYNLACSKKSPFSRKLCKNPPWRPYTPSPRANTVRFTGYDVVSLARAQIYSTRWAAVNSFTVYWASRCDNCARWHGHWGVHTSGGSTHCLSSGGVGMCCCGMTTPRPRTFRLLFNQALDDGFLLFKGAYGLQ